MSIVFVVSAPSGTGKSTLVSALVKRDDRLDFGVSVTTRPRRRAEVDGKAYRFLSVEQFMELRDAGSLLEWAGVFGHFYGTPMSAIESARVRGRDVVLDIDVQGASSLREKLPDAVTVFILPPSQADLRRRLTGRSTDPNEAIERRLSEAAREVEQFRFYDYVIVNRDIDEAVNVLHSVVVAERSKRARMDASTEAVLDSFAIGTDAGVERVK